MKTLMVGLLVGVLSWLGPSLVVAKLALEGLQRIFVRPR
jgi:hypothetical protein